MDAPQAANATEITKQSIRTGYWDIMLNSQHNRRPYPIFQGLDTAVLNLTQLKDFQSARTVLVNCDKVLENVRMQVLEQDKELLVPSSRDKGSLMRMLTKDPSEPTTLKTVSRWNISKVGRAVPLDEPLHIDLIVWGSIAVARNGQRIGKGRGWDDLHFAILQDLGIVDNKTKIVTLIDDSQLFDTIPKHLFEKHDVPVDWIVTKTDSICVENKSVRPSEIYWDLLTKRHLNSLRVLQQLRTKHQDKGRDVALKPGDESEGPKRARKPLNAKNEDNGNGKKSYRRRFVQRKHRKDESTETNNDSEPSDKSPQTRRNTKRSYQKLNIDFTLLISNIGENIRVRDIKNALTKHAIKPDDITWKGNKGFCYLHFSKPFNKHNNKENGDPEQPFSMDTVIECLQSLKLKSDGDDKLCVNVMEPITRIETTDVTSV